MATYNELHNAMKGHTFAEIKNRIWVASLVKASSVLRDLSSPESRKAWAWDCIKDPDHQAWLFLVGLIGISTDKSVDEINTMSDAAIQELLNATIDALHYT